MGKLDGPLPLLKRIAIHISEDNGWGPKVQVLAISTVVDAAHEVAPGVDIRNVSRATICLINGGKRWVS